MPAGHPVLTLGDLSAEADEILRGLAECMLAPGRSHTLIKAIARDRAEIAPRWADAPDTLRDRAEIAPR